MRRHPGAMNNYNLKFSMALAIHGLCLALTTVPGCIEPGGCAIANPGASFVPDQLPTHA